MSTNRFTSEEERPKMITYEVFENDIRIGLVVLPENFSVMDLHRAKVVKNNGEESWLVNGDVAMRYDIDRKWIVIHDRPFDDSQPITNEKMVVLDLIAVTAE